jgi:hypothetical protein
MRSLGETQTLFRRAVAGGPPDAVVALLKVPADPLERLEIYRRHYRESFRRHVRGRYPTLEWLLGTDAMVDLADTLLREHPPRAPSLAEYGADLVDVVAARRDRQPAWLSDVARLDWHLGNLSVAIEEPPLAIAALAKRAPETLLDTRLRLQPGLVLMQSDWPVDQLVHLRLGGGAPERLPFDPLHVFLELRGGRGKFWLQRLAPPDYAFRRALREGRRLGIAVERALGADRAFDLSSALARLFAEGLVAAIPALEESAHV